MTGHNIALKALSILSSCGHIRYVNDGVQVHTLGFYAAEVRRLSRVSNIWIMTY